MRTHILTIYLDDLDVPKSLRIPDMKSKCMSILKLDCRIEGEGRERGIYRSK